MGIKELIGSKSKVEEFRELAEKAETKEELRELETHLLKPEKLPPVIHEVKYLTDLKKNTVRLVFGKSEEYELFCKHFRVLNYIETNVTDIHKLIAFLQALEEKIIIYQDGKIQVNKEKT
jgi:redox-sensitive bicupin YhaK (pirin superfamily)